MLFTVEAKGDLKTDGEIELYLDTEGLDMLLKKLQILREKRDHLHFMTPSWAGHELTENKVVSSNQLINHLRITLLSQ